MSKAEQNPQGEEPAVEESAFALAYAKAMQNEDNTGVRQKIKNKRPFDAQQSLARHLAIKDYQRKAAEIEATRVGARNIGAQWSEFIESPLINPRAQKTTIQAWRPLFSQLTNGVLSEGERASVIFELMLGMGVSDRSVTEGQMHYLKGVSQKGWFQEVRRIPGLASSGVVYFVAAFTDLSELTTRQRGNYLNFLRRETIATGSPASFRLDRVTSRWLDTVGNLNKKP